jgi:hypothetical protein
MHFQGLPRSEKCWNSEESLTLAIGRRKKLEMRTKQLVRLLSGVRSRAGFFGVFHADSHQNCPRLELSNYSVKEKHQKLNTDSQTQRATNILRTVIA